MAEKLKSEESKELDSENLESLESEYTESVGLKPSDSVQEDLESKDKKKGNHLKPILFVGGVILGAFIIVSVASGGIFKKPDTSSPIESSGVLGEETEDMSVPEDYRLALRRAKEYSNSMYMSKTGIYNQLTSEYGDKLSDDAANYALEHLKVDWKVNAFEKAKIYADVLHMSKDGIYNQLISEYGDEYSEDDAKYAMDNLQADWNSNALFKAKNYKNEFDMSSEDIYNQLTSESGDRFTEEEAKYAVDNLEQE